MVRAKSVKFHNTLLSTVTLFRDISEGLVDLKMMADVLGLIPAFYANTDSLVVSLQVVVSAAHVLIREHLHSSSLAK